MGFAQRWLLLERWADCTEVCKTFTSTFHHCCSLSPNVNFYLSQLLLNYLLSWWIIRSLQHDLLISPSESVAWLLSHIQHFKYQLAQALVRVWNIFTFISLYTQWFHHLPGEPVHIYKCSHYLFCFNAFFRDFIM